MRRFPKPRLLAAVLTLLLVLSGCTGGGSETGSPSDGSSGDAANKAVPAVELAPANQSPQVLDDAGPGTSLQMSAALFTTSPVAVVLAPATANPSPSGTPTERTEQGAAPSGTPAPSSSAPETLRNEARDAAVTLGVPLFMAGTAGLDAELDRLGVETLVTFGKPDGGWQSLADGREIAKGPVSEEDLPEYAPAQKPAPALVLKTAETGPEMTAALATAEAAKATIKTVKHPDPRASTDTIAALRENRDKSLLALGGAFAGTETFTRHVGVALNAPELPGGGQLVFPGRRMVSLYGHPGGPALGVLGEQGIDAGIQRAKDLAAEYQPYSDQPVIPAFEIITTVASSDPGADGDYSAESTVEQLRPWIDAAEKAGVYVVLDLQSGRTDFLTQAKLYEELLKRPNVGLALDPEWRLGPGQHHMVQIGSVDAVEINLVSDWLAALTRENQLPQKVLLLHQFSHSMITNRDQVNAGHDELAMIVHADGHGNPGMKLETYRALQVGLPEGIWMGWKNFYDEDSPTFTPEQTYTQVDPKPWFVSYQ